MSDTKSTDTVPGLGFKDKDKALETIKALEGRDPDYQKFAVKGLIGRANRTLSITKAEDKLTNIKDALKVFEEWLGRFEKMNLSKENMSYLPLATVEVFTPLQSHYDFDNAKFIQAYKKAAEGDYKRLRTVESGDGEPTWDIVRNTNLKKLRKEMESNDLDLWTDDGIPTKIHAQMIMWAYSPENSKIKKTLGSLEEKVQKLCPVKKSDASDDDAKSDGKKDKSLKRKSGGDDKSSDSDEDETPQKKKRSSSSEDDDDDDEED